MNGLILFIVVETDDTRSDRVQTGAKKFDFIVDYEESMYCIMQLMRAIRVSWRA